MRKWKKADDPQSRIFLYFQEHPFKFFTPEHVASQVRVSRRKTRELIGFLEAIGKLESVDTVSTRFWGRPRKMYRAIRGSGDALAQLEIFNRAAREAGFR